MSSARVWLVTGSSSGFGRHVVVEALARGETVVATLRKPSDLDDLRAQYPPSQLLAVRLDVTKTDEIADAFRTAKHAFGRVDVVFNNAGTSFFANVEGTPEDRAHALFDVNFWGAANVMREAVRFFREENAPGAGGVLINLSSVVAVQGLPVFGYYSASKHALDGLTQALASELDPKWNIKIINVLPSFFRTDIDAKSGAPIQPHPAYTESTGKVWQYLRSVFNPNRAVRIGDPKKAAEKIYEASRLPQPPFRLPLGPQAVEETRKKAEALAKAVEEYGSWSDDVLEEQ